MAKNIKKLTESQLELLQIKSQQIQTVIKQAQALQNNNDKRIERMKVELGIEEGDCKDWRISKDGKSFEEIEKPKKE